MTVNTYYEPGLYKCQILDQGFTDFSSNTEWFLLKFLVLEPIAPFRNNVRSYSRMAYFPFTDDTGDQLTRDLRGLGFKGDDFLLLDLRTKGHHSFVGNEFELMCCDGQTVDGEPCEDWELRGAPRPLDRDRVRRLNRFLSKHLIGGSPVPATDSVTENDPPF
jgi:hypothetical protein